MTDASSMPWRRERGRADAGVSRPLASHRPAHSSAGRSRAALKRAFDIVASAALVVFTLPLLAAVGLAVRLDGPLFHRQERVGRDGRRFLLIKFRSMPLDAESGGVPRWPAADDPRATPVGRFIRRTRIDEIPQAINVLKGDMSLVGPRPERPYFVARLAREIPGYRARHRVRPGLAGLAQLDAPYGAGVADARRKLARDLAYIERVGLGLDLAILWRTAGMVLSPGRAADAAARPAASTLF